MADGLRFWRKQKGLYARGVTPYPIYTQSRPVAFNLCKFPRNATDKADWAQFPTSSSAVGSEDPREGAPRVSKYHKTPRK